MKAYDATSVIEAAPATIWAILTDAPGYSQWDSGVIRVDGRIAPGEKLKLVSEANPKRTFSLKVTEFRPDERMTWEGGMPLGLFRGCAPSPCRRRATAPGSACGRSTPARSCR
jgi:hypothetical protein